MRRNGRRQRARRGITRMIARIERLERLGRVAKQSLRQRLWDGLAGLLSDLTGTSSADDLQQQSKR